MIHDKLFNRFMKMQKFLMSMVVAATIVCGISSCSDDDVVELATSEQVVGSYAGEEISTVMNEDFTSTTTYVFQKAAESAIEMTIPEVTGGAMTYPALAVKNITLTQNGDIITGKLDAYTGTVINAQGAEKAYTVSNLTAVFSKNAVAVTYTMKYGNMPFDFSNKFTGTKK